ncbi:MAG: RNA helicase, partial [Gammaproteobacteria bacterium]
QDAGADEVWSRIASGQVPNVKLVQWKSSEELDMQLVDELVEVLELESEEDEAGFGASVGGHVFPDSGIVHFNNRWKDRAGAAESAENWQILSPLRAGQLGVDAVNRMLQLRFRQRAYRLASGWRRKIPKPMGSQAILWGDKVINVKNSSRRKSYPPQDDPYVANGDIGVVVGKYDKKGGNPWSLEVEMAAQTGSEYEQGSPKYTYNPWEFGDESSPPLELAYALTVHKTQGSEFGTTLVVIPNPCRLLSREMLYTALTRHREKVVIFHQGEFRDIRFFGSPEQSQVARRLTNLFTNPEPVDVEILNTHVFLDANMIHRTQRGERVRSKSELIIADKLHAANIEYMYEPRVNLAGVERYPDFVIEDDEAGETWYWEHLGMMSNPEYAKRWDKKLAEYRSAGILPLEEGGGENGSLITTKEYEGQGFDSQAIDEIVQVLTG